MLSKQIRFYRINFIEIGIETTTLSLMKIILKMSVILYGLRCFGNPNYVHSILITQSGALASGITQNTDLTYIQYYIITGLFPILEMSWNVINIIKS